MYCACLPACVAAAGKHSALRLWMGKALWADSIPPLLLWLHAIPEGWRLICSCASPHLATASMSISPRRGSTLAHSMDSLNALQPAWAARSMSSSYLPGGLGPAGKEYKANSGSTKRVGCNTFTLLTGVRSLVTMLPHNSYSKTELESYRQGGTE